MYQHYNEISDGDYSPPLMTLKYILVPYSLM